MANIKAIGKCIEWMEKAQTRLEDAYVTIEGIDYDTPLASMRTRIAALHKETMQVIRDLENHKEYIS